MTMIAKKTLLLSLGALALGAVVAEAQAPAGAGRQAVEERRAVYKLIGANFRPLGAILKGEAQYDAADDKDQAFSDNVKTALTTVAQDCKGCHDDYKLK